MKVKELIEALGKADPEANVIIEYDGMRNDVCEIYSGKDSREKVVCFYHHFQGKGQYHMSRYYEDTTLLWESEENKVSRLREKV